jgi:hypothetical protein
MIMFSDTVNMYLLGVLGSVISEVTALLRAISANNRRIPTGYYTRAYIVVRTLFAFVVAGSFAALLAQNPWTAVYIGITAPLLYDRVAAGIQDKGRDIAAPPPRDQS